MKLRSIGYLYGKFVQKFLQGKRIIDSTIHKTAKVNAGVDLVRCNIGKYSYLGYNTGAINTEIGAFCSIATNVFIGGAQHPMDWVSTSPVFQHIRNSGPSKRFAEHPVQGTPRTIIGNDVWIGHGAIIKSGITIGDGAVIGTGAVVVKDVPPYAIVGGVPAKVLKYRFPEAIIQDLLSTRWWDASDEKIQMYSQYINDYHEFIARWKSGESQDKKKYRG